MKAKRSTIILFFLVIPLLLSAALLPSTANAAYIFWGTHKGAGAKDLWGDYIPGIRVPGGLPDLSNGALVQLIKATSYIDDPVCNMQFYEDTSYTVDDVILEEVHIGYGLGPPGAPANGEWSRSLAKVDLDIGDVIYVRVFNQTKSDFLTAPLYDRQLTIRTRDPETGKPGGILSYTITVLDPPQTYYFDNLRPIPEPAALAFLLPGLAIWLIRRRKHRSSFSSRLLPRPPRP